MTACIADEARHPRVTGDRRRLSVDELRRPALAILIAALSVAAHAAFTHEPGERAPRPQGALADDWRGNSASLRPAP